MFIELNGATGSVCVKGSTTFSPKVTGKPESRDRLTEGGYGLIVVIAAGMCVLAGGRHERSVSVTLL